jgi:acyl phosphate:glycerol-3-phosphate acyltransferase
MTPIWMTAFGFLLGSIPFSVWLGRLTLQDDIRRYGDDRNPGAANAWRAGKWKLGIPVLLLDFCKGALPVGIAHYTFGITDWWLVPVALAPVFGHAFSPFLNFQGGKGLAVTFGMWTGLTLAEGPLVLGGILGILIFFLASNAWALIMGMLLFLIFLVLRGFSVNMVVIWFGNMLLLSWKHRHELNLPLRLHPRIIKLLRS